MYNFNKQNLLYDNFTLKNKLSRMKNLDEVYSKQVNSYKLIYDKALSTIKKDLDKTDKLADFNGLTKLRNDDNIDKKKKKFHELEIHIFTIKQNTIDNQAHLDELKKNIIIATAAVKEQSRRNYHMLNHNTSLK